MPRLLRVLHLEDSRRDAEVIRHMLDQGDLSCDILVVDSKDRFEAALTQEPFDLVFCDYDLPGYDGISALTYAHQARPDVPVIVISGTVGDEEAVRCLHLGATDYLLKDRLERLASAVERAIQEGETRRIYRRTQEKLRRSEALNRSLVEHLPQRILVKDLNSNYVFCNAVYARDLGMDPAQIVGKDDFAFFSKERAERYRADDRQVMTEGTITAADECHTVDGTEQWIHAVKVPYRDEQEEIIGVLVLLEDISERKRAEEQRAQLAALVDASPDFIGCVDPRIGQITYINRGGRQMCGIGEDEDVGTLKLGDVHPSWMEQRLAELALPAAELGGLWQGDGAFRHRDGREIPVSMAVLAHRGADGAVDFFYTVSHDITERKRAELVLRGERDRAQRYLDTAEVILLKLDLEGRIVLVNRYGCSLLGWAPDELLGRNWIETCLPVRMREELDVKRRRLLGGDLSITENPVITKSGEERLVEWRNRLLRDDEGLVIGSFSSGTDITERHQAVDALRTAEERMRFALEAAGVGIWDLDFTADVVRWSETLEAQYGLQPRTFGGTFEAFIECVHPDDRASVLETVGTAVKAGADFSVLNRSIWPDGTVRWLSGAGRMYLGARGEPVRGVGISQDVTERKLSEDDLHTARNAADAANRAKSEFLANMSHELRTPMNGVIGMTQLVLDSELTSDQRDYLEIVRSSADSLLAIIDDILDYADVAPGKLDLDQIDFRLDDAVRDTAHLLAFTAHQKGLELIVDVDRAVPAAVRGDPGRLRQILVKLLGNAIKFTSQGEIVVRVTVDETIPPDVMLRFSVMDTGVGIPLDRQDTIFQAFTQADGSSTRKYGGTGLGLSIASQLVHLMGGRVWVASEPGKGSTFHFTAHFKGVNAPSRVVAAPDAVDLQGLRALIVDDSATNRRLLEEMLTGWKMAPTLAGSALEALAALRAAETSGKPIPLVLADVRMPDTNGLALAEIIRRDPAIAGARVVMLTSASRRDDGADRPDSTVAAYLPKPITRSRLHHAITLALSHPPEDRNRPVAIAHHVVPELNQHARFLLVEDNLVNQLLARRLLEKRGHAVVVANDGQEAVTILEAAGFVGFDCVLMDVQMPKMNGYECTAFIRDRERVTRLHLPIIALTAHASAGDEARCLAVGMDAYLTKPIQPKEFCGVIEGHLRRWGVPVSPVT